MKDSGFFIDKLYTVTFIGYITCSVHAYYCANTKEVIDITALVPEFL